MNIKKYILRFWPILLLGFFVILLFLTNYRPGTILSGWDNLHPEFDFGLNIKRSIFAVWQEYQGLGLLGGMAHSTDLLRQLFLLFLSLFLPIDSLRYIWTFLMLFVGSTGAYFLIKSTTSSTSTTDTTGGQARDTRDTLDTRDTSKIIPFLGATFYLLNLSTVQMFYVPFESFIGFFGFLPWLLWACLAYYPAPSRKHLIFLVLVLLLATPAWYLQTVFIVFMLALSIILSPFIFNNELRIKNYELRDEKTLLLTSYFLLLKRWFSANISTEKLTKLLKLYSIIFLINSFWLLPAAYFTITNSQVNLNSKINQMATGVIFAQNKEFGTLPDVMLLKGFLLNGVDPNSKGVVTYMLATWRGHLANPFVVLIGFLLFAIVFLGFIKAIKSKNAALRGFSFLFIFSFIALAIDTPPFSFINSIIRDHIPLLNQIFRFPFTKFSTLASLVFAVLFAVGVKTIFSIIENRPVNGKWNMANGKFIKQLVIPVVLVVLLILFTLPAFQGHLLYDNERTKIPSDYNKLFAFFKSQDPNTRIANFPQNTFWGWSFYKWSKPRSPAEARALEDETYSYGGSGFIWYGIKQPILDRAFDVWSNYDENYYFEISKALYSKRADLFSKTLNKYQINWLFVDKNIYDSSSNRALFIPELGDIIDQLPQLHKVAAFGKLEIYKVDLLDKPKNFVFLSKNLPTINKYNWNNYDQAYLEHENYISPTNYKLQTTNYYYPFRSLFSLKSQNDKEFVSIENLASVDMIAKLPPHPSNSIILPSFIKTEKLIPIRLSTKKTATGTPVIVAKILLPQVLLDGREISKKDYPVFQIQLPQVPTERLPLKINVNSATSLPITNSDSEVGTSFLTLNSTNILTLSDNSKKTVGEVVFGPEVFSELAYTDQSVALPESHSKQTLTVRIPKIYDNSLGFKPLLDTAEKIHNCDIFRGKAFFPQITNNQHLLLDSTDASACTSFFVQGMPHNQGYAIFIKSAHVSGQALRFWVENINQQYAPLDTYLPKNTSPKTSSFILPPMEEFGTSYAFHFDNSSIGRDKTVNDLNSFAIYPVFYNYLTSLKIAAKDITPSSMVDISNLKVDHPNESLYIIQGVSSQQSTVNGQTLVLSQSYNPGWHAYTVVSSQWSVVSSLYHAFPFIFGKEIKNHVMVNNWENGWVLNDKELTTKNRELIIIYLPQYLEYFGFGLLILTIGIILSNIKTVKLKKLFKPKHTEN